VVSPSSITTTTPEAKDVKEFFEATTLSRKVMFLCEYKYETPDTTRKRVESFHEQMEVAEPANSKSKLHENSVPPNIPMLVWELKRNSTTSPADTNKAL
jgi:hypothetical protein